MVGQAGFAAAGEVEQVDVGVVVVRLHKGEVVAVRREGRGAADAVALGNDAAATAEFLDNDLRVVVGIGNKGDSATVRCPGWGKDGLGGGVEFATVGAIHIGDDEAVFAAVFTALFEDVGELGTEDAAFAGEAVEDPVGDLVRELARIGVAEVVAGENVTGVDVAKAELAAAAALHVAGDDVIRTGLFPGGIVISAGGGEAAGVKRLEEAGFVQVAGDEVVHFDARITLYGQDGDGAGGDLGAGNVDFDLGLCAEPREEQAEAKQFPFVAVFHKVHLVLGLSLRGARIVAACGGCGSECAVRGQSWR